MRIFSTMRTDQISPTLPPYRPYSVRKPDKMRTFLRPLYLKKKKLFVGILRKHAVAGQSYIDILNAGVDEYTCQILFLNTVVSCPRCLKTNSYGFKIENIPKYSEFQLCNRNQTFSCILFLRNFYLTSKFYFFMLWT